MEQVDRRLAINKKKLSFPESVRRITGVARECLDNVVGGKPANPIWEEDYREMLDEWDPHWRQKRGLVFEIMHRERNGHS